MLWPKQTQLFPPKSPLVLSKEKFIQTLEEINNINDLLLLKNRVGTLKAGIENHKNTESSIFAAKSSQDQISLYKDVLIVELDQILNSQTIERARYYIKRLKNSIQKVKTSKINDINILRWKEYNDITTDSLWILDKRDTSGAHLGWYWGNFVPQIPHQMMLRYTKQNDWVLDPFLGSGTTLIECRRLGRNGIGIELNSNVAQKAKEAIEKESNKDSVITDVITGDSKTINLEKILKQNNINKFQLIIMHPPYSDIIKFSNDANDLSNTNSTEHFLEMFGQVVDNISPYLEKDRYLVLVIGDKYSKGEWIPLGFYSMQEVIKRNFLLKSIVVKNFEETRGKRNQKSLWRYRALVGGFYVFKHEYIMIFKKE